MILFPFLLAVYLLPIGLAGAILLAERRIERRDRRRSPLNDKLLHQPGSLARRQVDAIRDKQTDLLTAILMVGPTVALFILAARVHWSSLHLDLTSFVVMLTGLLCTVWLAWRLTRLQRERRNWQQGMWAEIAVAQQLDRLRAQGCTILHDLPADNFNVDHIVIGSSAVYAVETKSRRKPGTGRESANVVYDGKALRFPGWTETRPLDQVQAIARWLAQYLKDELGERVPVLPVLCLPGWFVDANTKDAFRGEVRVINPKMTSVFLNARDRTPLSEALRNRIFTALQKRIPDVSQ